jgi:hypothetical protein
VVDDHVGDLQLAAGAQNAIDLVEHSVLVGLETAAGIERDLVAAA